LFTHGIKNTLDKLAIYFNQIHGVDSLHKGIHSSDTLHDLIHIEMGTFHESILNSLVVTLNDSFGHGHDHFIEQTLFLLTDASDILTSDVLIRLLDTLRSVLSL